MLRNATSVADSTSRIGMCASVEHYTNADRAQTSRLYGHKRMDNHPIDTIPHATWALEVAVTLIYPDHSDSGDLSHLRNSPRHIDGRSMIIEKSIASGLQSFKQSFNGMTYTRAVMKLHLGFCLPGAEM